MNEWLKILNELPEEKRAEVNKILIASASSDKDVARSNRQLFAAEFSPVLRQGVLAGSNIAGLFQTIAVTQGSTLEMPLDVLAPGTEKDFIAYAVPNAGRIPERAVEGDYIMVPTYTLANSIDWNEKYAKNARWDVVSRCLDIMEAGMVKKMNDDGWHTIMYAAVDRNVLVFDSDAANGLFTKRFVELMKLAMRRNGGGNGTSLNRFRLSHLALSPEALSDMRSWGVDQIDEVTRREIFTASDGSFSKIYGVILMDLDEFGEGQEYQSYLTSELGASMNGSDTEFAVGMDLNRSYTFVMAESEGIQVREATDLQRQYRQGYYCRADVGFGVLDNRAVILGSF